MTGLDKCGPAVSANLANDFGATGAYRCAPVRLSDERPMQLARVRGNVVTTIKASGFGGHKLLLLQPVPAGDPLAPGGSDALYVAIDLAGAGIGEVVLVSHGSAARVDRDGQAVPTDAAIVAIVDSVQVDGQATFVKG